jgi:hypothetical protein
MLGSKKWKRCLGLYIVLISLFSLKMNTAHAIRCDEPCASPSPCAWPNYGMTFGAELTGVYMSGKHEWHAVFPNYFTGGTVYAGYQFLKWLGLEVGYTQTTSKTKKNNFDINTDFFQLPTTPFNFETKMHLKTAYMDINYFVPLSPICGCFDLIGSVGLGIIRPSFSIRATPLDSPLATLLVSLKPRTNGVTRCGLGLRMRITDHIGVRLMLRYQQTSLARVTGNSLFRQIQFLNLTSNKVFKDQGSANIGFYAEF